MENTLFVDVILPVPIPHLFTYRIPYELNQQVVVGARVVVSFGKNRILTGVIAKIHTTPPEKYKAKYISELLDNQPMVTPQQLWLFHWISEYYMAHIGDVLQVALPAGLKISSLSKIQINPAFRDYELLDSQELIVTDLLKQNESLSYSELELAATGIHIPKIVKNLIKRQAVFIYDVIQEKYKPLVQKRIRLQPDLEDEQTLLELINELKKRPLQQAILLRYLSIIPIVSLKLKNKDGVSKMELMKEASDSALKTLIKNEIIEPFEIVISRLAHHTSQQKPKLKLSEAQKRASDQIMKAFESKPVALLHGITGSGKTEVYIDIIQKALEAESQVLYLLPEIALTTQIVDRLKGFFGTVMGVYHSKFSDNERVDVYQGLLKDQIKFVIGVRSAIFLPFNNLGLIIVDEEHEASFKQFEPSPRYHARDVAVVMAHYQNAKVILGSATPSLESYHHALNDKYALVTLKERFGDAQLPTFEIVDLKAERKNKTLKENFSQHLLDAIQHNLDKNQQSIIFQNRRGYAPYLNCKSCNWIGHCSQCTVSQTYHLTEKKLVCHYCGLKEEVPLVCPQCGAFPLKPVGLGTERIEGDLKLEFPQAQVQRMDLDTTRNKNAYQNIIENMQNGHIDILIGTQMLSKGLDFDRVNLVAIPNADSIIYFPDFRASERAFQLLTQVSGRAGRRGQEGKVIIQTGSPNHKIIQSLIQNDYESFFASEIEERQKHNYPPFVRLIQIQVKDLNQITSHQAADQLTERLLQNLNRKRVLGPEKALVERVRNKYIYELWLKLEKDKINVKAVKKLLNQEIIHVLSSKNFKNIQIIVNVDPV